MSIDRKTANGVIDKVRALMKPLAEEQGLSLSRVSGSFHDTGLNIKVTFGDTNDKGETEGEADFKLRAYTVGLHPSDLHKKFMYLYRIHEVVGFSKKRYKYPIQCLRDDGTTLFFHGDIVKRCLLTEEIQ